MVNTRTASLDDEAWNILSAGATLSLSITHFDTPRLYHFEISQERLERKEGCLYLVGVIEPDVKNIG